MRRSIYSNAVIVFGILLLSIFTYIPSVPAIYSVPERDNGVFLYIAGRMLSGQIPYRDVWDHKPIGAYILSLAGLILTPGSLWGPWVLSCLWLASTALFGFVLFRQQWNHQLSLAIICIWLPGMTLLAERGPLFTELTALPFQIGAVWLATRLIHGVNQRKIWVAIGGCVAACVLLKPPLVAQPVLALLLALWYQRRRFPFAAVGWATMGVLLPIMSVTIYLAANQALAAFVDQVLVYNIAYSQVSLQERFTAALICLRAQGLFPLLALFAWMGIPLALWKKQALVLIEQRFFLQFLWIAWPVEIVLAALPGRTYLHYYVGIFWLHMALIGWVMYFMLSLQPKRDVIQYFGCSIGIILGFFAILSWYSTLNTIFPGQIERKRAAEYIQTTIPSNEVVFIWGAETSIYVATRRVAPTRLVYQYPLYTSGYDSHALLQVLQADLATQPPCIIIDASTTDPGMHPNILQAQANSSRADASDNNFLKNYIVQGYTELGIISNVWPVYKNANYC